MAYGKKYEVFSVNGELVYSDSREKIITYAKNKNIDRISYKFSTDKEQDEIANRI